MTQHARITRVMALVPLVVILVALGIGLVTPQDAHAANTASCYGAGCNGLDPVGRCDGDAITVRAMNVPYGMLELRYSSSCRANWGRYTPYTRSASYWESHSVEIYARVTVWNPGAPSYGLAHDAGVFPLVASSWSYMTDGRPTACTGVEVVLIGEHADTTSLGWTWGPCY